MNITMAKKSTNSEYHKWLKTRPKCIQELAKKFPMGSQIIVDMKKMYLIGWTEPNMLIFSNYDPYEDYDLATKDENKLHICADHVNNKSCKEHING